MRADECMYNGGIDTVSELTRLSATGNYELRTCPTVNSKANTDMDAADSKARGQIIHVPGLQLFRTFTAAAAVPFASSLASVFHFICTTLRSHCFTILCNQFGFTIGTGHRWIP